MVRGKKGFDRLVYACNHVLNVPVTWLFCNLSSDGTVSISKHCFIPFYLAHPDIPSSSDAGPPGEILPCQIPLGA